MFTETNRTVNWIVYSVYTIHTCMSFAKQSFTRLSCTIQVPQKFVIHKVLFASFSKLNKTAIHR